MRRFVRLSPDMTQEDFCKIERDLLKGYSGKVCASEMRLPSGSFLARVPLSLELERFLRRSVGSL